MTNHERKEIAIVGAGFAGTTMALALRQLGYPIVGVASRNPMSAKKCAETVNCEYFSTDPVSAAKKANVILLSTPDDQIRPVCELIASGGGFMAEDIVLHMCGSHGTEILESAKRFDAHPLAFHPIQTFADPQTAVRNLKGAYFALEGDPVSLRFGESLVEELEGKVIHISSDLRPIYHAALCVASNYLVTITDISTDMLTALGIDKSVALDIVLPLIQGTVNNLSKVGLPKALTGPISRGDIETIENHLVNIRKHLAVFLPVYKALGELTVKVAIEKGTLTDEVQRRLLAALKESLQAR